MKVEEGLFYINNIDMATYGCFLWEEHAGDHTNYDSLMKPPPSAIGNLMGRNCPKHCFPDTRRGILP